MPSFFAAIFHTQHARSAVAHLHNEVAKSSDRAISAANALEETIKGVVDRKRALDTRNAQHAQPSRR